MTLFSEDDYEQYNTYKSHAEDHRHQPMVLRRRASFPLTETLEEFPNNRPLPSMSFGSDVVIHRPDWILKNSEEWKTRCKNWYTYEEILYELQVHHDLPDGCLQYVEVTNFLSFPARVIFVISRRTPQWEKCIPPFRHRAEGSLYDPEGYGIVEVMVMPGRTAALGTIAVSRCVAMQIHFSTTVIRLLPRHILHGGEHAKYVHVAFGQSSQGFAAMVMPNEIARGSVDIRDVGELSIEDYNSDFIGSGLFKCTDVQLQ